MSSYSLKVKTENSEPIKAVFRIDNELGYVWCCGMVIILYITHTSEEIDLDVYRYQQYSFNGELLKVKTTVNAPNSNVSLLQFDMDIINDILAKELSKAMETRI